MAGLFENQSTETTSMNNDQPMQGAYNDPFQRVANAEVGEKTAYFEPGVYPFLYLDVIKMVTSRKGDQLFIAEFDIVDSDVPSRPKGSRAAWIANFRHEPTPGNVRGFMAALNNVGVEEITADALRFACSDKNPCHGNLIRLEAVLLTTDKDGNPRAKPFTRHDWRPVPKELQKQAEELRTKAGFPGF